MKNKKKSIQGLIKAFENDFQVYNAEIRCNSKIRLVFPILQKPFLNKEYTHIKIEMYMTMSFIP